LVTNLGLASLTGLDAWVAAQLTAAGANKGAKVVELLNGFSQMTADTTYGTYATAFNAKVDAALAASQTTGKAEGKFETAGVTAAVTSFTLTTNVEAIVGSAGDDTITAPATVAATGAAQTTINSGDSIDGGAGTDTLTLTLAAANNNSLSGLTITNVEKISYVGSDNLGAGASDTAAALTAKTASDAAALAAGAAAVAANQVKAAYTAVKALTETQMKAVADLTTSPSANYTLAQYKAAAIAARSAADGTTLDTGAGVDDSGTMQARATVLETAATTAATAADAALVTAAVIFYTPINGNLSNLHQCILGIYLHLY
jgi:hypothetical protein